MNPISLISSLFKPAADLIDSVHTSDAEREQIKVSLYTAQAQLTQQVLDYESKLAEQKSKVIIAEAQGKSWLQRNWRPLLMMTVIVIIFNNYVLFPYISMFTDSAAVLELPDELFTLLTYGVTGYVVGRSGEKIASTVAKTKNQ